MSDFSVERLRFWHYFKIQEEFNNLPRRYKEYEDLIKIIFFRFFGIEGESVEPDYDLAGFEIGVKTFVIDIFKWKKKCKGYSSQFESKPFMFEELSLKKRITEEEPMVEEDVPENEEEAMEEVANEEEVPFRSRADRTQRKISAEIRELYEPEAILKVSRFFFGLQC